MFEWIRACKSEEKEVPIGLTQWDETVALVELRQQGKQR